MTLLSNVGGASGPLFGTFFIRAAQVTQAHQSLSLNELYQMMREGAEGVIGRGKAEPGDKTMCDVWVPVAESLRQSCEQNLSVTAALDAAASQAEAAAQSTITMQARKGRASYGRAQYRTSGSGCDLGDVYDPDAGSRGKRVRTVRW